MRKLLLLIAFSIISFISYSQYFKWVKTVGIAECLGKEITHDDKGNVYTIGYFKGTVDFDPGAGNISITSVGNWDIFILKLDSSGNFIWVKTFGTGRVDMGKSIACDNLGNVYSMGGYDGTIDFDPGSGTANLTGDGTFLLKLDSSGNFVWAKSFAASSISMVADTFGNTYTTGEFYGTVDFDPSSNTYNLSASQTDVFVTKFNASGNLSWAKNFNGVFYDYASSIAIDNSGNVYTTGTFATQCDFDPGVAKYALFSTGQTDIFISKLDPSGNFIWAKNFGGNQEDHVFSLTSDEKQNVIVTGYFQGTVDFDPGSGAYKLSVSAGADDIFIASYNKSGNFVWAKKIGGPEMDRVFCIRSDIWGNIYYTGYFRGTVDFDPSSAVYNLKSGYMDMFFSKLDSSGNFIWVKNMGGSQWSTCENIFVYPYGDIYMTGNFQGKIDFDPGSGTYELTAPSTSNAYMLKTLPCTTRPSDAKTINAKSHVCEGSQTTFSINWVSGATRYKWVIPPDAKILKGKNSNSITVLMGKKSGYVKVTPFNSCGVGSPDSVMVTTDSLPIITISPESASICFGESVSLTANGANNYLWKPSKGLNDSTKANIKLKPDSTTTYRVSGKNTYGCEDTTAIRIIVTPIPTIKTSPWDTIINVGSDALFFVAAFGTKVSYQWQQDSGTGFINLVDSGNYWGVTYDILTIYNIKFYQNNWKFRCITSNGNCSDTSDAAKLTANCILHFTKQPVSKTLNFGSNAQFVTTASSQTASYKWQQNSGSGFVNISDGGQYSGATNDTLTINGVKHTQNDYKFRCIIIEDGCSDTSNTVSMTINCTLNITSQPSNQTVNAGSNVLFIFSSSSVSANYQWIVDNGSGFVKLSNGGQYSGVTNDTLTINDAKFSQNNYKYKCIAEDGGCLDTTNTALLKVNCVPNINTQPTNQTANVGSTVLFTLISLSSTANYQWQQNSGSGFSNLSDGGQYSGVTNDTLTISNLTLSQNNYSFRCKVIDYGCSDSSEHALLTVKTIGIKNFINQRNFSVYPNPTNNFIIIESSQSLKNLPYFITDQTGRQILKGVLNSKTNPVDLSSLAGGFYFLQIGGEKAGKFLRL